jgi:galactokinase/mevalonate kinase-like predicted kinase
LGAGNGGFILVMFASNKKEEIIKNLKKYQYLSIKLEKNGTTIL